MGDRRLGMFVAGALITLWATGPLGAQSSESARTPWGDPDLQGIWSYASLTPLQRPTDLGDREFFTPEEAAARNAATSVDRPPRPGDTGTYNALWFDRGTIDPSLRTSLIVDPPDGRLPLRPGNGRASRGAAPVCPSASRRFMARSEPVGSVHHLSRSAAGVDRIQQHVSDRAGTRVRRDPGREYPRRSHHSRWMGRPRLNDTIRQWNGDSRGHWESDTLVVETANYHDQTRLRFPSSPQTRAVERFTRVNDDLIDYQFTIEESIGLHTDVDGCASDVPDARLPDLRVLLSRGQLCALKHLEWRAAAGEGSGTGLSTEAPAAR